MMKVFNLFKKKKIIQLPTFEKLNKNYDVVVHVGAPKTGSSAIQKYLLENRDQLLKVGFYYPEHGLDENGISGGHHSLPHMLIAGDFVNAKALMQTYLEEAKQHNCTLLISSESLYGSATQLKQIIGDYRCKILAFFRDPLESLYSNYNQGIKRNYLTARLESHCQNQLNNPTVLFAGNILNQWEKVFGKAYLTVLEYDLELFTQIPIQSVFLSIIGVDNTTQKQFFTFNSHFVNNGYSLAALELKRMLNFVLDQDQARLNNELDWFLQGVSDKDIKMRTQLNERISAKMYTQLKEKCSPNTQKIRNEYLSALHFNQLTEKKQSTLKTINPHELNLEMTDLLSQLKQKKPHLYHYAEQQLAQSLQENNQDYEIVKLAEMFNYDLNQIQSLPVWFHPNQLKNMPNMQLVELYRDIAQLCYHRGDLHNAQLLIEKALEIRPQGPAIIKLSELIKQAINDKPSDVY